MLKKVIHSAALDFAPALVYLAGKRLMRIPELFRRNKKEDPQSLRIEGVADAPMTPEPDDTELAAQALLEMMAERDSRHTRFRRPRIIGMRARQEQPDSGTVEYYERVAEKMRQAHDAATLRTIRFVAFCEEQLALPSLPIDGPNSLSLLENELFKRIDTVEREGGELKSRWQHCVAEVTVRLMQGHDTGTDVQQHSV